MPRRRPIRNKLLLCGLLAGVAVTTLFASSLVGVSSYRRLVRALSNRAAEMPLASELGQRVDDLRLFHARTFVDTDTGTTSGDLANETFTGRLVQVERALELYREQLDRWDLDGVPIADRSRERATASAIAGSLTALQRWSGDRRLDDPVARHLATGRELDRLATLTAALPSFLQERLHDLSHEVRTGYRTLIIVTWAAAVAATALLVALGVLIYRWVFRPLRHLGHGSRRVATGDFDYRIQLDTDDEMAELAEAFNGMTARFQDIRDDLDRQVELRTREVIRSEQLASVGFLAAGVAHEINNPLASIAMCAESLESRVADTVDDPGEKQLTLRYLQLIQSEAFRCKEITEKLLDFSRLGEVKRQATAIKAIVSDVAEMLRHVGRFAGRSIEIADGPDLLVFVNPQEIKQVVLNLLVNALDCIEPSGCISVRVARNGREAEVVFVDDGCGMTDEVLSHLFEPFFTRRKNGQQGTGLGLSIVHRIVVDHGGRIEAVSDGPGKGATFTLTLPLAVVGENASRPADAAAAGQRHQEVDYLGKAA
ncbi:MAG: HAMP domain-containing protein [Pirellulales bacterium]|jgi:two-component system NtrC family sensor kinase|nr:HAMP domain-containing protein [Pirellulales bacterium]